MNARILLFAFTLLQISPWGILFASDLAKPAAMATLSRRSAKPGDHVELVVTVRSATHPTLIIPTDLADLRFHVLRKPRLLQVDDESVWLFRYRVIPTQIGEYEIPPLEVIDGNESAVTKPLFLHVSKNGELPPLSAEELALGVNIPESLSQEVLKAAPHSTPKPEPSPAPPDLRPLSEKAGSAIWKGLKAIWNYPGK